MTNIIRGYHCTNGYHDGGRGTYRVDIRDGRIFEADWGDEVWVRQYGADAPILTNGVWEFWPDAADLARLGIVPAQMIVAESAA